MRIEREVRFEPATGLPVFGDADGDKRRQRPGDPIAHSGAHRQTTQAAAPFTRIEIEARIVIERPTMSRPAEGSLAAFRFPAATGPEGQADGEGHFFVVAFQSCKREKSSLSRAPTS